MTIKIVPFVLVLAFSWSACKNDTPANIPPAEPTPTEIIPAAEPGAALGTTPDAAIQTAAPNTAAVGTAGMKNPPHGEPGHVCGKPVGSILDGKEAPTTQVAPTTTASKPAAAPAGSATTVAPGSNPPHGQPGHRCDIAVGAPLDSKPKQ